MIIRNHDGRPLVHDRMVELARTVSTESLKEPGGRAYGLWADPDVRGRFRIFEEWDSQEALTEHSVPAPGVDLKDDAVEPVGAGEIAVVGVVVPVWRDEFDVHGTPT